MLLEFCSTFGVVARIQAVCILMVACVLLFCLP